MRVLFVGNHTVCNNLPGTIGALAEGVGERVEAGRFLRGGAALKTHVLDNRFLKEAAAKSLA
jgi:hypothetical protein